jgi:hypothetical protein
MSSPRLAKAVAFLRGQGVERLTNDLIRQALVSPPPSPSAA